MALLDIRQRALRQAEPLTQTDQVRGVVRRDTRQPSRQTACPGRNASACP